MSVNSNVDKIGGSNHSVAEKGRPVYPKVCALTIMLAGTVIGAPLTVQSPNGKVTVAFDLQELSRPHFGGLRPYYRIYYENVQVLTDSPLELRFVGLPDLFNDLRISGSSRSEHSGNWDNPFGAQREIPDNFRELTVHLERTQSPSFHVDIIIRAFNEGVAFRYRVPQQTGFSHFTIAAENTGFFFAQAGIGYALNLGRYNSNYEGNYKPVPLMGIQPSSIIGVPLLVHPSTGPWAAILEADLSEYGGMYLAGVPDAPNALISKISPHETRVDEVANTTAPSSTPWRVILLDSAPGGLIEKSYLILNLNPPSAVGDTSWITTGSAVWDNDPFNKTTAKMEQFIDFAAKHHLPYDLTDVGWAQKNTARPFLPVRPDQWVGILPELGWSPVEDILHSIPAINLPEVIAYAKSRHVKVMLWIHWTSARGQMKEAFPFYEKLGLAGFKIDFMNDVPDDQSTVELYHDMAKYAAEHHLVIDIHGAYKPAGLRRTYPNLITREAVMGLEYDGVSRQADPEHEVTLPFTRMLAGPMDYTPGCFNDVTQDEFTPGKGTCQGTRAHQLALYVVFLSPLQMINSDLADLNNGEGLSFIEQVPTVWDKTKVLAGEPGQLIVIARKKGDDWYIGGLTNWTARDFDVSLDFLHQGRYHIKTFADADDADRNATSVKVTTSDAGPTDHLRIHAVPGGGFAASLVPVNR